MSKWNPRRIEVLRFAAAALVFLAAVRASAQFDSGSSGANGTFPPTAVPDGTTEILLSLQSGAVTFNPSGMMTNLPNVPDGGFADGTLEFTTFDVPEGATLRFLPATGNPPVDIRAQGDVVIEGTIDVSGQSGGAVLLGGGGLGGPGAFSGGQGKVGGAPAAWGLGPGGGRGAGSTGLGGGYGENGQVGSGIGSGGPAYGTPLLRPLIGGSGGGGGGQLVSSGQVGPTGGGGGGAIGIASSATIRVSGSVRARGGSPGTRGFIADGAGGGSGGAIRLTANVLEGSGSLDAGGGTVPDGGGGRGGAGRIRLEAFNFGFTGAIAGLMTTGAPGPVVFAGAPRVRITSVDTEPVSSNPNGALRALDIEVGSPGSKSIEIGANNVPVSTTVSVVAKPANGNELVGPVMNQLQGTFEFATTTVELNFPSAGLYFIEAQTVVAP